MQIAILKMKKRTDGAVVGLLLSFLFWGSILLRCGDVESNPGPNPPQRRDSLRQTRLLSERSSSSQESSSNPQRGASTQPGKEPSMTDLMAMMQSMQSSIDEVKQEMKRLREESTAMREELRGLKQEVSDLRQQNNDLQKRDHDLTQKLDDLVRKVDDLEGRSKRNNLIFYGLPRHEKETSTDCENVINELITDKLEFSRDVDFDRVHRLNSKPDSPVIVRCTFYKQKIDILKAKTKLKGTNIFIGEDFTARVREIRRKLTPHLKKARGEGKRVSMVYDHLIIDGKRFAVGDGDNLVMMR